MAVSAGGASAAAVANAAPVRTLKPHEVASWVRWLGAIDDTRVAYGRLGDDSSRQADTQMVVRPDAGPSTTFAPPAGCTSWAPGSHRFLFSCGFANTPQTPVREHLAVTSATGDEVARVDRTVAGVAYGVGTEWIEVLRETDGNWTTPAGETLLNWHTGEAKDVDPTDAGTVIDPDSATGLSALCPGVRAVPRRAETRVFRLSNLPVWTVGSFALVQTTDGVVGDPKSGSVVIGDVTMSLHRCGSSKPVTLPSDFRNGATLGYGWLATSVERNGRSVTDLIRLSDRRRFTVPMTGAMTFTRHRLYLMDRPDRSGGDYVDGSVFTVVLPRK